MQDSWQGGCPQIGALGAPAFSGECSELEEEETWPEVRAGFPLEEWG